MGPRRAEKQIFDYRATEQVVPKGWTTVSRSPTSPERKLRFSMELLRTPFTFELLFLIGVAKILLSELQFCEQMCMPSFSFLFGSLGTSPRKKWCAFMNSRTCSFYHHLLGPCYVRTRGREGWNYPWVTESLYQQGGLLLVEDNLLSACGLWSVENIKV